jgi:DHA2 family multidrug resistance protein-like MFS transporter
MLPAGALGDRYGRKKVMLISLALFALGSAACAAAPSSGAFIAARVVLGIAGSGVIVMAVSALTVLFDEQERPKAVGVWAAANFIAIPIGPILGGWLLTHYWWGWVFLMNVPITVLGLLVASVLVPESRAARPPGLDPAGAATSVAGLLAMTNGLIEAGQHGWGRPGALVPIIGGVVLLGAFFAWERRRGRKADGQPLLDLRLFRSRAFTWGVILAAVAVLAMIGVLFTMPQYFQGVLGTDAMGSGLRLLPMIGGLIVGALPADRLVARVGAKLVVTLGFGLIAAGLLIGSGMSLRSSGLFIAVWMAILGVGMGLATATASSGALSELSEEHSGVGSAVLQAVNKTGGPFGTAILGSVLSSAYLAHLDLSGLGGAAAHQSIFGGIAVAQQLHSQALLRSVRAAFVHGTDQALLVSAVIAIIGAILAIMFLPASRPQTAASQVNTRNGVVA